ncbi:hypothetical protein BZA05DRAFT_473852 [Tricharina praecox]|uniref:uncharacterized protein n=1 Tax=Tricharina praecox TaxID=43433 RepID=UPI0022209950|nr:uncharacterized protein BZA05DRAFT_473852 [Tricharina praecox]KAI5852301.1 hypothetical protein BZA05DRAFT_473852 [Tricharina praecox]
MATLTNPRRILLVGTPNSGKLTFLKSLTGTLPPLPDATGPHAGLSHEYQINTPYYSATVPVWVDELPAPGAVGVKEEESKKEGEGEKEEGEGEKEDAAAAASAGGESSKEEEAPETLQTWTTSYLSASASEVLSVLGSLILTFRSTSELSLLLSSLHRIVNKMGMMWDGVCLAVAMADGPLPEGTEDTCLGYGFELVEYNGGRRGGRNEYGEATGMDRVVEALAAGDWAGDGGDDEDEDEDGEDEDGKDKEWLDGIGGEMEREMMGLKVELAREDRGEGEEEGGVENLEAVLARLQMVKDMGDELPMAERRKLAAKNRCLKIQEVCTQP